MKKLPVIIERAVSRRPAEGFASRVIRHPNAPGTALEIAARSADVGIEFVRGRIRDAGVRAECDAYCAKMAANVQGIDSISRLMNELGDGATESHLDRLVDAAAALAYPPGTRL